MLENKIEALQTLYSNYPKYMRGQILRDESAVITSVFGDKCGPVLAVLNGAHYKFSMHDNC